MMWVALDRAAKLASGVGFREEGGDEWRGGRAGEVRQYVLANQPRMFTKYFGSSEVDSACWCFPYMASWIHATRGSPPRLTP